MPADPSTMPKRELGFWMCTALVVGNTIGIGIFMMPAALAPYGLNALTGWIITAIGCLFLARVFARLARLYPAADGPYAYIRSTLGHWPAYLSMWSYWVSNWITNATLAVSVVGYLYAVVPALAAWPPALFALAFIWLFVAVNVLGTRAGGRVQVACTALKLLPMAAVIGLGAFVLLTEPAAYTRSVPATPLTFAQTMAASTIALFAMLGLESASIPAGRVRDPGRNIPRATLVGTLLTAVIYVLVSTVPLLLIPQAELAQSGAPFVALLDRELGAGNGRWLALFVVVSGLGALNGWTLIVGNLTATMATQGDFPAAFARLNRHGAPGRALVITGLLASAMVLMNYSKSLVDGFVFLSTIVTAANLPLYLCSSLALVVLWRRGERAAGGDLRTLGTLGTAYVVLAFIGVGHVPFLWALALAAAGVPVALWARRGQRALSAAS
ncbi:MAG: amino acid permease [Steroidobacteraceae bacterium]